MIDEQELRRKRHIREETCDVCRGWGGRWYPSTATWQGGMGGAAMTYDVCDECWGSGDVDRPWTDLRKQRAEENERINAVAARLLSREMGEGLRSLRNAQLAMADVVEAAGRKRRLPDGVDTYSWHALTTLLSKRLRKLAGAS